MGSSLLLIGGGGHCKSVLDSLLELNAYDRIGIIDKKDHIGDTIMGVSVIGCDDDLPNLLNVGYKYAFVTLGSIGKAYQRVKLFELLTNLGYEIPNILDQSSKVSSFAKIGKGVFIGKKCIVNTGVSIGDGSILNTGSIVEHDCHIGSFVHISPGAVLGGEVVVRDNTHIGLNTSIRQNIQVGAESIIGMGSVVVSNVPDSCVAYGNPCRVVKRL